MIFVMYLFLTTSNWQTYTVTVRAYQTHDACVRAAERARKRHRQAITHCVRMKPV